LLTLLLLTVTVGPIGAVPYAIEQGLSTFWAIAIVCLMNVALVPVWFKALEIFGYGRRYLNFLTDRARSHIAGRSAKLQENLRAYVLEFERRFGHGGFFLGMTTFSFVFGTMWASIATYFLNLKKMPAMISIAAGVAANTAVFGLAAVGLLGVVPSPYVLYAGAIGVALLFCLYGKMRERMALRAALSFLRRRIILRRREAAYSSSRSSNSPSSAYKHLASE